MGFLSSGDAVGRLVCVAVAERADRKRRQHNRELAVAISNAVWGAIKKGRSG